MAGLDDSFGVVSDEDTLTKELYSIQQGAKESVNHYDTCIGYAMIRLTVAFLNAIPPERSRRNQEVLLLGRPTGPP